MSVNVVAEVVPAIVLKGPLGEDALYIVYDVAPGEPVHVRTTSCGGDSAAARFVGAGGGLPPAAKL